MELVKAKFKQTEVGLIPEDWNVLTIEDVAKVVGGGTPSTTISDYWKGNIEWFTPTEISHVKYSSSSIRKISIEGFNNSSAQILPIGTILMTTRASIGDMSILLNEATTNQGFQSLIAKEGIYNEFLYYLMLTKKGELLKNASGSTFLEISPKKVKAIYIPIPPNIHEQKAIATALSDVDDLIANLNKLITKKKAIKQGAMQQLLTPPHKGGNRLVGFIGEWEVKKLGDVAQMNSGGTPSSKVSEYYNGDINWVSITDMTKTGKYIISSGKKITEEGLQNSSARLFPKDTVLLAMYASIGKCTIAKAEVTTSQAILGITVNNSLNIEYLYYYLIYKKNELISQGQQGTQSNLNKDMVKNIIMCLPQIKEQNAIAKILSDMDLDIEQLETEKTKYQDIKQGMMQELLTGKTRLV